MIDVAIDAARLAGALTLRYFGKIKNVSYKGDNSPVTLADIEAEIKIIVVLPQIQ